MFLMQGLTVIVVFCVGMFLVCIPFALIGDGMSRWSGKRSKTLRNQRLEREAEARRQAGNPGKGLF